MEHLNCSLKTVLHNFRPSSFAGAAKSGGVVDEVCDAFKQAVGTPTTSDCHNIPPSDKDFKLVLLEKDRFVEQTGRKHGTIYFKKRLFEEVDGKIAS